MTTSIIHVCTSVRSGDTMVPSMSLLNSKGRTRRGGIAAGCLAVRGAATTWLTARTAREHLCMHHATNRSSEPKKWRQEWGIGLSTHLCWQLSTNGGTRPHQKRWTDSAKHSRSAISTVKPEAVPEIPIKYFEYFYSW